MKHLSRVGRWRPWLLPCTAALMLLLSLGALNARAQSSQPAAAAAAPAPPLAPVDAPHADSSGATGGDNSLITPNAGLPGWTGGGTDSSGNWHAYNDDKGNPTDTP